MEAKERYALSDDGLKLFYRVCHGKKKPYLVFLHGIGCNWTVWEEEIEFFETIGYSTLAPDMRGHGKSEIPEDLEKYYFPNFAKDLRAILDKEKIKDFVLIGHSLGGGVALKYCYDYKKQQPKKLVLIETAHRYPFEPNKEFNLNPLITHMLRFIGEHQKLRNTHFPHTKELDFSKGIKHHNAGIFLQALHVTPLKSIMACLDSVQEYSFNHIQDTEDMLTHLKTPVLIIAGGKDIVIPMEFSEELHWLIKNSKLKVVVNAHHRVIIENPKDVAKYILEFLERKKR